MPVHTQKEVKALYEQSLASAEKKLSQLEVADGQSMTFKGLKGWVFEQTIQHCLRHELSWHKLSPDIQAQVSLGGRAEVDLLVGNIAIEIKRSGLYEKPAIERYSRYAKLAKQKGWRYLYITGEEGYSPYWKGTVKAFGKENSFFLDDPGEWNRFVRRVISLLKKE